MPQLVERGLTAAGALLRAEGVTIRVIANDSSVLARRAGLRVPPTLEVLAVARPGVHGALGLSPPDPLPVPLRRAVTQVAREIRLPADWLCPTERDLHLALPPDFADRLQWREYGGLHVGLLGRPETLMLRLHAIAGSTPTTFRRERDALMALRPDRREVLSAAAALPQPQIDPEILETLLAQLPPRP